MHQSEKQQPEHSYIGTILLLFRKSFPFPHRVYIKNEEIKLIFFSELIHRHCGRRKGIILTHASSKPEKRIHTPSQGRFQTVVTKENAVILFHSSAKINLRCCILRAWLKESIPFLKLWWPNFYIYYLADRKWNLSSVFIQMCFILKDGAVSILFFTLWSLLLWSWGLSDSEMAKDIQQVTSNGKLLL